MPPIQVNQQKFFIYGPNPQDEQKPVSDNGIAPSSAKGIAEGLHKAGVPKQNIVVSHDMSKLLEGASRAARQLQAGAQSAGKPKLVMPGGIAPVIQDGLNRTMGKLQKLLHEGNIDYVGVCAGCYLAAEKWVNKGKSHPMLGLVVGLPTVEPRVMAKPLPVGQFPNETLRLHWEGSDGGHAIKWHGGPKFEDEDSAQIAGYKVLATAEDAKHSDFDPAVVFMRARQGKVTLSSVHPEYPLANEVPGVAREKRLELFRLVFGLPPEHQA